MKLTFIFILNAFLHEFLLKIKTISLHLKNLIELKFDRNSKNKTSVFT